MGESGVDVNFWVYGLWIYGNDRREQVIGMNVYEMTPLPFT